AGTNLTKLLNIPSTRGEGSEIADLASTELSRIEGIAKCEAAIASVNPKGAERAVRLCERLLGKKPCILGLDRPVPIGNRALKPEQVGMDRLVNALAAFRRAKGAAIVLDFGTALTFDVVDNRGDYLGGVITPGIGLAMRALSDNTALLPLVKPQGKPDPIGRDTESAINSGVYYGYIGLARNIIQELSANFPARPKIYVTGGDGEYLASGIGMVDEVVPALTLEGIRLAYFG
ncbi:MAG: type III pantothenate kinase, partial [Planctomycetes bacterium]|nr:type III pantothenate kinase [Planctomycetota bacterium]